MSVRVHRQLKSQWKSHTLCIPFRNFHRLCHLSGLLCNSSRRYNLPMQFCFVYNVSGSVPPLTLPSSFDILTNVPSQREQVFFCGPDVSEHVGLDQEPRPSPHSKQLFQMWALYSMHSNCTCYEQHNIQGRMYRDSSTAHRVECLCGVVAVVIRVSRDCEAIQLLR